MKFTVNNCEQRTSEWFAARVGRLTGSYADHMLAAGRGKEESVKRRDLRLRLVTERLTGRTQDDDGFTSDAMKRGIEMEPAAIAAYELDADVMVQPSGFLSHNDYMVGCSLDGHVGNYEGIVETKCPKSSTHLRYLKGGIVPSDYLPQITHNLWVSGAAWCDFVSFDDRFPEPLHLFRVRVKREDVDLAAYETAALKFLAEVDFDVMDLKRLTAAKVA